MLRSTDCGMLSFATATVSGGLSGGRKLKCEIQSGLPLPLLLIASPSSLSPLSSLLLSLLSPPSSRSLALHLSPRFSVSPLVLSPLLSFSVSSPLTAPVVCLSVCLSQRVTKIEYREDGGVSVAAVQIPPFLSSATQSNGAPLQEV